jgi:hypothetical protein
VKELRKERSQQGVQEKNRKERKEEMLIMSLKVFNMKFTTK